MEARNKEFCEKKVKRSDKLKSATLPWMDKWQEVSEYFAPRMSTITVDRLDADINEPRLLDDIGTEAAEDCAAGMINYMMPAGEQWARLEPDYNDASPEAKDWYTKASRRMLELMTQSGFYLEAHDDLFTWVVFGTSNMKIEKGTSRPYKFEEIPIGKYWVEINEEGLPDLVYFEYELTVKQCAEKWGKDELHDSMQEALGKDTEVDVKHKILQVVYPRDSSEVSEGYTSPTKRPYGYCFIDMSNYHLLEEGGTYENPFVISRFMKANGTHWGHSIGQRTLSKVRQLNEMEQDRMLAAEKRLDPPWIAPDEGSYEIMNVPGGINYYKATLDPRHRPEQLDLRYDVHTVQEDIDRKRQEVRRSFFADMFTMFQENPAAIKTATLATLMQDEKMTLFTPAFARYTKEKIDRIIERCFNIGIREGYFEEPPEEILINGSYRVTYTSRIANTIRLMENRNLFQFMEIGAAMLEIDDTVRMKGKWREMLARAAENLSIDPDLINSEEDIREALDQRAQQQQAEQAAMMAESITKSASQLPEDMRENLTG